MTWPTILAITVGGFCALSALVVVGWCIDYVVRRRGRP